MQVATLDFETYWAKDYSLSLKRYNTSGYVRDSQFKAHGVGIKINGGKTRWVHGEAAIRKALDAIDWTQTALNAHNTAFDGAILAWHYGHIAAFYYDTLSMTRGLHNEVSRAKLDTIAKLYEIGAKSETYLAPTKGLRELPPDVMKGLGEGCIIDTDLCYEIFKKQIAVYPKAELTLIDLTLRMFIQPVFQINQAVAEKALQEELAERTWLILASGVPEKSLTSNPKFAVELEKLGVEVPMKLSATTGKQTYAFSQTDEEFLELLEHDDRRVVCLAAGRLAAKSTLFETRGRRLIDDGTGGLRLPVLLNYFGAKTGRWSGGNKTNMQNLPRLERTEAGEIIERGTGMLRLALEAPDGHRICVADSAQIEARTIAWLAGQSDIVELFARGEDVYCHMASIIYGRKITKKDKLERFIGKLCLAEGTLIYSDRGWIEIETLRPDDKLWDGDNWVCHSGLVMNGSKETLQLSGLWLTPDHLVWSGTEWKEAQSLEQDAHSLYRALDTAAASSPSQAISEGCDLVSERLSFGAAVDHRNTRWVNKTSRISKALDAIFAPSKRLLLNAIGSTLKLCRKTITGPDYSTVSRRLLRGVTVQHQNTTYIMEHGGLRSLTLGEKIVHNFSLMSERLLGGIARNLSWIAWTLTKGMNLETFDLSPAPSMQAISGVSPTLRRKYDVYDVLLVGPKNRFLALTKEGPLLVHNCTLGLGYGMGANKFQTTLALGIMGPAVELALNVCKGIVNKYRAANSKIVALWKIADNILADMARGKAGVFKVDGEVVLEWEDTTVWLPNGMGLHYPELRWNNGFSYLANGKRKKIYGGLLVENIVQALARIIVADQMLDVAEYLKKFKLKKSEVAQIGLMTHDEIVSVMPERLAEKATQEVIKRMRVRPRWAKGVPLDAEGGHAARYEK